MDAPLKLGAGELLLQRPGEDAYHPIGHAEGARIDFDAHRMPTAQIEKYREALQKLTTAARRCTLTLTGLKYDLANLRKVGLISDAMYRRWRRIERQRRGEKVFYPHPRRRMMRGK